MIQGQIVIVVDAGNYKSPEPVPFKAELYLITDYPCFWVRSLETGLEYELYEHQILEGLRDDQIAHMIDISKHGDWDY